MIPRRNEKGPLTLADAQRGDVLILHRRDHTREVLIGKAGPSYLWWGRRTSDRCNRDGFVECGGFVYTPRQVEARRICLAALETEIPTVHTMRAIAGCEAVLPQLQAVAEARAALADAMKALDPALKQAHLEVK
jgi:hypothetical protein